MAQPVHLSAPPFAQRQCLWPSRSLPARRPRMQRPPVPPAPGAPPARSPPPCLPPHGRHKRKGMPRLTCTTRSPPCLIACPGSHAPQDHRPIQAHAQPCLHHELLPHHKCMLSSANTQIAALPQCMSCLPCTFQPTELLFSEAWLDMPAPLRLPQMHDQPCLSVATPLTHSKACSTSRAPHDHHCLLKCMPRLACTA